MYGIDKVKEVVGDGIEFFMKVGEARDAEGPKGKKINIREAIGPAIFAVPKALDHVNDAEKIKNQVLDADTDERREVLEFACVKFDLENDKAEYFVEKSLYALAAIGDAVEAGLAARKAEAA